MHFDIIEEIEDIETIAVVETFEIYGFWIKTMGKKNGKPKYALCVENRDCDDLEKSPSR